MVLLIDKAGMTIFAMLTCVTALIEISADTIAWSGRFGCRGFGSLMWAGFEAQEHATTWVFGSLDHRVFLAFMMTYVYECIVVVAEGVEFV